MKTLSEGRELARSLVSVGKQMGVKTAALLTDMHQPNGRFAGNAVEVNEAVETLAGAGPADVRELALALGAELLVMTGEAESRDAARIRLSSRLDDGSALEKFREMVRAQGGDLDAPRPVAPASEVVGRRSGFIGAVATQQLGLAIVELGGGRKKKTDAIDHSVGLEMLVRHGDYVDAGQPLVRIFAKPADADRVRSQVADAFTIVDEPPRMAPLIVERFDDESLETEKQHYFSPPHDAVPAAHTRTAKFAEESGPPS
jgi:thymidine phosphorylase